MEIEVNACIDITSIWRKRFLKVLIRVGIGGFYEKRTFRISKSDLEGSASNKSYTERTLDLVQKPEKLEENKKQTLYNLFNKFRLVPFFNTPLLLPR